MEGPRVRGWALRALCPEGVPAAPLAAALSLMFCEAFANAACLTFLGFLVLDFGMTDKTEEVGFYVGFLSLAFFGVQFLGSFAIGFVSDKLGRKPVLLAGAAWSGVFALLFGFSFNYWYALAIRAGTGVFNINSGVVKSFLGDISTTGDRVKVFSDLCLTTAIASITGSYLGGWLSRPAVQYPKVFGGSRFFKTFPFFLPNFVCFLLCVTAFVLAWRFIGGAKANPEVELQNLKKEDPPGEDLLDEQSDDLATVATTVLQPPSENESSASAGVSAQVRTFIHTYGFPLYLSILYACSGLISICFRQLLPVWAMASVEAGGLGFSAIQIGVMNSIASFMALPIQLLVYTRVTKKIKLLWSFRLGCAVGVPTFTSVTLLAYVANRRMLLWLGIIVCGFLQALALQHLFAAVNTMITNSVERQLVGRVNGAAQALASLCRALGPAAVAPLFAWCLAGTGVPLLGFRFPFVLLSAAVFALGFGSAILPTRVNAPKESTTAHLSPSASPLVAN
eukprot:TRINITY_DN1765_c0_g1_i10.p1 TRINITY_DN1765_c0_g1~~TRINITY_DN1765_c0_g1_i10.p1  ORF type:complete len:508 (-),score=110.27 TRINITY_DN1765_c0_g1_i10:87-1610(-)